MEYADRNPLKDSDNLLKYITSFDKIFIFSDFDGTLARLRKNPCSVRLSKKASKVLDKFSKNLKIITGIVSGRKISELEFFLGDTLSTNINLFGCHGAEIKFKNKKIIIAAEALKSMKSIKSIQEIIEKKYINIGNLIFEKKESSFAVNYRNVAQSEKMRIEDMKNTFLGFEKKYPVKLLDLKKVFEIVPYNVNKSFAIKETIKEYRRMLKESSHIFICLGDDTTDENLFMENLDGINIKIRPDNAGKTHARFFLNNIQEVILFLSKVARI